MEDGIQTSAASAAAAPKTEMVNLSVFELLEVVPPAVKEYLLSDAVGEGRTVAYAPAKLTDAERDIALYTELQVYLGQVTVKTFADVLWTRLNWADDQEDRAAQLAADILGRVFFPVEAYVGDVGAEIDSLGFDPSAYPHTSIAVRKVSYSTATDEVIAAIPELPKDGENAKRARRAIESRLRGIRDEAETKEALAKSAKVGGPGLTPVQMNAALAAVKKLVNDAVFSDTDEQPAIAVTAYPPEKIKKIYAGSQAERKTLAERKASFSGSVGVALSSAYLGQGTEGNDALTLVAALLGAAEERALFTVLSEDEKLREAVMKDMQDAGLVREVELFRTSPADAGAMNAFLQTALRRRAKIADADAARFALKIATALKKQGSPEYAALVAFDPAKEAFTWTVPVAV